MNPDFDVFCLRLAESNPSPLVVHPAEIHGLACGLLAAGLRPDATQLAEQINDYINENCILGDAVVECFQQSLQALESDQFEFQLCLPDDDTYGLDERLESLAAWCGGFLHGIAAVQEPLNAAAQELLHDLTEISHVDTAELDVATETTDEHEADYSELTEFVRMAVISLFMDHNRPSPSTSLRSDKHDYH